MKVTVYFEHELNRAWILNENDETIGETNFVVPTKWLIDTFSRLNEGNKLTCRYSNFEEFEDSYEPETEGELVYQCAIKDGALKEDLGVVMYE